DFSLCRSQRLVVFGRVWMHKVPNKRGRATDDPDAPATQSRVSLNSIDGQVSQQFLELIYAHATWRRISRKVPVSRSGWFGTTVCAKGWSRRMIMWLPCWR